MIGIDSTYASSEFHQWQLWDKNISHVVNIYLLNRFWVFVLEALA
jgi:hypothetical protein